MSLAVAAYLAQVPSTAWAQQPLDPAVGAVLTAARERYAIPEEEPVPRTGCGLQSDGEIVVCKALEDPDSLRLPSRLEEGDDSHLKSDVRPPDVAGDYIFRGPATAGGMCVFGPCPREMPPEIDFAAIPEPPPGSDAEAIARGERRPRN